MHSVRRRCSTQISLVTNNSPWTRSYCNEWKEGHVRVSEKKKFLKVYENVKVQPPSHERHPKIPVPIKPFQAKKTPETDPWLFLVGVFPKSVQEYNKEAEEKRLNPPGMEFQGVWLDNSVIENAKRDRFAKELITFRDSYEKPVVDAFKEVDAELEANYTKSRFEERKKTRKHQKSLKKKAKPGSTLLRYMEEKDYWEKFVSAMHIGNFSELPLRKETDDLMTFEALKFDIEEPSYDYNLIKHDYGQRSDWTVAQHMALMVPDDEIEQLKIDNLLTPENLDQIYRYVKELEHVYGPLGEKISNITRTHIQAVDNSNAEYLRSKNKEIPPKVWEVFNPEHIKEFDDIQDPDKVSLEEIDHRLEQAFQNWKKRLLDPEVERRVKHYVRHLMGGDVWPRFTVGGNNRLVQFADSPIANKRIFLNDADQVRILKGQLVDAGLAKVIVRRRGEAPTESGSGSATESASGADSASVEAKQPEVVETPEGPITRPIPLEREKSPILTDDANAYLEFLPTYKDRGTFLLPPKQKVVREETRESLEESFQKEIMTMDDRNQGGNPARLARSKREKYLPVFRSVKDYERLTPDELKLLKDNEEENILAHRQFQKWRTLWPHPTTGEGDMDGEALKNFMKSDRWFPVNHLFYKHNVEFFVRTLPLAPELKRADLMRMRKVVMRVYVAPLELPPVVDRRLKQLLGPRYNQPGKTVTLTGSDRHTQKDNKAYLKLLFREILHEAWLADPNYLPTREPAVEPPRTWRPSQAANETAKPIIFRLYGTPLQNQDAQKTQVDQINSIIGGGVKAPESTRDQDYEKRMEELKNYDTGAIINTISYGPPKVKRSQQQKQQQEQPPTEQEQEQGQEQKEQKEQQVVASGEKPTLKKRKELGLPIAPKKAKPMNQAFIFDKDIVYEVEEEAPAPTPATPAPAAPAQKDKKKK